MKVVNSINDVILEVSRARREDKKIGFVPTMGFLHRGHLSLIDISKEYSQYQVMSIFVNRIQFNNAGDFGSYPKNIERDLKFAEEAGVDLVFMPDEDEMYRDNLTFIDVEDITTHLCGGARPGHFRGVFTVVGKLFNIVQPDYAVFGQKDIQQISGIEKMVVDLNFPVKIIMGSIVRESDGLAMSSRNKHLNSEERKNSLVIYKSIKKAELLIENGERESKKIVAAMEDILLTGSPESIDYISVVDYKSLSPIEKIEGKTVIAVALFFGTTRLIDNMVISFTENKIEFLN